MYRIDDATAATSLPVPESAGAEGYFTEGNPAGGTPATNVRGSWLNMIQEELCAILAAAGITRSKTIYNQVNQALQQMYAPVIGTTRNLSMNVAAASAIASLTADEIVVGVALGGQKYILPSFNKTVNLAATGAGGMDTGTAPVSGFVAIYAIWNPTTQVAALLATNATSAIAPNVYGGANMPAGYTASALVTVWPTNASSQFQVAYGRNRRVVFNLATLVNTNTTQPSFTSLSVSSAIPKNAIRMSGKIQVGSSTTSGSQGAQIASNSGGLDACEVSLNGLVQAGYYDVMIITAQTIFYTLTGQSGIGLSVYANGYEF